MSSWCLAAKDKRNFGGLLLQHWRDASNVVSSGSKRETQTHYLTVSAGHQPFQIKTNRSNPTRTNTAMAGKLMQQDELEGQYNVRNPIQCYYVSKLGIGYPQTFWWGKEKEKKNHKPAFMWPLEKWPHYWVTFHLQIHSIPKM